MKTNWKSILDHLVPKHVTLSQEKQQTILEEAEARLAGQKKPNRKWQPAVVGVVLAAMTCLLMVMFLSQKATQNEKQADEKFERLVMPYEYSDLMHAQYDYINHSFIMLSSDRKSILNYKLDWIQEEQLIKPIKDTINDAAVNEEWIVYATDKKIYVQSRLTDKKYSLNEQVAHDIQIFGDKIAYSSFSSDKWSYRIVNLKYKKITEIPIDFKETSSHIVLTAHYLLVSNKEENQSALNIYNLSTHEVKKFNVSADIITNLSYANDAIYYLADDKLQTMNPKTGKVTTIKTEKCNYFAVYQNYIAIGTESTVKLYTISDTKLKNTHVFDKISARLVHPRFSEEGVLVINSEDADHSIYTFDTNAKKSHFAGESKNWKATYEYTGSEIWNENYGSLKYHSKDKGQLIIRYKGDLKDLAASGKLNISYEAGSSNIKMNEDLNSSTVRREYKMNDGSIGGALMKNQEILKVKVKWGKHEEEIQLKLK
ncbi:hypothetical protein [Rummeliibacillus pycnus]|uniref:hypothetical protein n=1 Tax=Rummeliibacillus pycnus TaxID=101070 RepID=UPI0037CA5E98